MNNISNDLLTYLYANGWLVKITVILFIALAAYITERFLYSRLTPRLAKTRRSWDDSLLVAIHKPLVTLIWVLALTLILPVLMVQFQVAPVLIKYISTFRKVIFLICLLWFAIRYITNVEKSRLKKVAGKEDKTSVRAISQLMRVVVVVIGVLVSMQTLGISIATLLAAGGVGGIAIGFAAKDTIANFLGGMMIFWDRPFCEGDWIRSPDRNIEGTVENIGWRLTRIRTFDKRPLYVPNGTFSTISIENPSRMLNRRIKTTIGLRYDDATKVAVILKDVEDMLSNHPEIDTNQTLMVNLFEFANSSLNFFIYTFTKTTDWVKFQAVQQDVFLKTIEIIDKHGAECAFPTQTVHIPQGLVTKQ